MLNNTDKRKVSLLLLLDLSAAFDTIDHDILLKRLNISFGITGTALSWFKSYLCDRYQSVKVGNFLSNEVLLSTGVPQGSVLGPVLFTIYTYPLAEIIKKYDLCYHFYADDSQIYGSVLPDQLPSLISRVQSCLMEIKSWMTCNKLQLNYDKTEMLVIHNKHATKIVPDVLLNIDGCPIKPVEKVKSLGVVFDSTLTMNHFVSNMKVNAFVHLKRINRIRDSLTLNVTKTLIISFVLSRLDYCNSLLSGLPLNMLSQLQSIQNYAARVIYQKKRSESALPLLFILHWLPVVKRIEYKILVNVFKCLHNSNPIYLQDLIKRYVPARTLRSSSNQNILIISKSTYKTYGDRSFSHIGPKLWNKLPITLREAPDILQFKKLLKTFLFDQAYT